MPSDEGRGKRAALYVRVSTDEQTSKNQERELRVWAQRRGETVVKVYRDDGVSGNHRDGKGLKEMFEGAHRREFDIVLFWALDRLTRGGIQRTFEVLARIVHSGARYKSHQEEWLSDDPDIAEYQIAALAWAAKQEHRRNSERTKAGMARAKAQGTKLGRPPLPAEKIEKIKEALNRGTGIREAARQCGVSHGSVQRVCDGTRGLRKVWDQQRKRRKTESKQEAVAS
jgi:DNA invertase Pin-like site-specific DNA recombinase